MKRIEYIDVARGIGILLVVFGHALTKEISNNNIIIEYLRYFVYTVHMPLFFVISGFLFEMNISKYNKYNKILYVKDKLKKFIIPYLLFSILNYSILYFAFKISIFSNVLSKKEYGVIDIKRIVLSILTYIEHIDNHLWFLYVMFIILIINRVFIPTLDKSRKSTIVIISFSCIIYFFAHKVSGCLPEIVWKVMRFNLIFLFGRIINLKNIDEISTISKKFVLIIGIIFTAILFIIKNERNIIFFPFIKCGVELCNAYIIIFLISKRFEENVLLKYIGNGEKTMVIYLLHMPFLLPFIEYLLNKVCNVEMISIIFSSILTIFIIDLIDKMFLEKIPVIKGIFFGVNVKNTGDGGKNVKKDI